MNKQEVIEKIEASKRPLVSGKTFDHALDIALNIVKQLDEPEKPVVPYFVADWIEDNREALEEYVYSNVQIVLPKIQDDNPKHSWLNGKGIDIIVDCIRNGYEVEEEKLYTVEIPNPNRTDVSLVLGVYNDGKVAIFAVCTDSWKYEKRYKLTEAEIKKDFEWAWQFAKEIEE